MPYEKFGRNDEKYLWTAHVRMKMRQYGLAESRIKRVIRFPARTEEGVAEKTIAVMQPAGTKRYQEIWAMYRVSRGKLKIITAWRYPGKSPARDPIPQEILREVKRLL
jgi:hypothetical protein